MRKRKCSSSYSHFKPWIYRLFWGFFWWCFASLCILWMNYLELILWIKEPGSVVPLCSLVCILWLGLIVHLDSARTKTSRSVSWCQLWVESEETESGEWCKNSLVKWWWESGIWSLPQIAPLERYLFYICLRLFSWFQRICPCCFDEGAPLAVQP